ncbi:MAG: hypothetical protein JW808_11280 [Victivallales bacterium]|nr:hypothetical protein [Victivallales bacterium]
MIAAEFSVFGDAVAEESGNSMRVFQNPQNEYRLVQYQLNEKALKKYPEYGIGAFMAFFYKELYQSGPDGAAKIGPLVEAAHKQGMKVWLADDFGYPSGMAGGKVVEKNPEYEVRGLARVSGNGRGMKRLAVNLPETAERFVFAMLYPIVDGVADFDRGMVLPVEDTRVETKGMQGAWRLDAYALVVRNKDVSAQATMVQFKHTGRYPDLMNRDAVASFIAHMHAPLAAQIDDLPSKVAGFYSNEPQLMQMHWNFAKDAPHACLPWTAALPEAFRRMHGYDLMTKLGALYECDSLAARRIRMHFHQTVAELLATNFSGQITEWCEAHGVRSGGHFLLNQFLVMHVAGYGDLMKFASKFHVPGIDNGIPNPAQFRKFPYQQTRFFSSVAAWKGRKEVIMLLDPIIYIANLGRLSPVASLLHNSVNMAFFNGANQLSSYLFLDPMNGKDALGRKKHAAGYTPEEYRAFNEYVGRISMLLRGAHREASVALYYPITMFQADYLPSKQHWKKILPAYEPRQNVWDRIEKTLIEADLDYQIVHPEAVAEAEVLGGTMKMGSATFRYLVMPQIEIIPLADLEKLRDFEAGGGTVLWVDAKPMAGAYVHEDGEVRRLVADIAIITTDELTEWIDHPYDESFDLAFEPHSYDLPVARFRKNGRRIYYLVNRKGESITAHIAAKRTGTITLLDPVSGVISKADIPAEAVINAYDSLLVVD